ncbi:hypothetical protein O181_115671 [Austropuccinia psidii MF-1]|uniref:Uncharacterized protein n=1 Tax=Austropuccinia psidii MF-1 TaxID=1389203 RepID=A0A9Q3K8K4_9BASI|nr:hypothetical protein [Austropuccinia psidii MF-1]
MAAKEQDWELLASFLIGTMNSYVQVKKFMGPERTRELLKGWTPISCKEQVQQIKAWWKNKACYKRTRRRSWPKARKTAQWKLPKPPQPNVCLKKCPTSPSKPQRPTRRVSKIQRERQTPNGANLTL